jgi:hypothetical protein
MHQRREDRFGPFGAALVRSIIPLGLIGFQALLLPAGLAVKQFWVFFALMPGLALGVLWCVVRNITLSHQWAKLLAAFTGVPMLVFSVLWAVACVVGLGGI